MGAECCKMPCPGLDLSRSDGTSIGQRFQINREQFTRRKFLIGDKTISAPNGLQNPAFQSDSANLQKGKSNGWERPTLTVPTEAVVAAIAAAEAAAPGTPPVPPPRIKRNRQRQAPPLAPGTAVPATPAPLPDESQVTPQQEQNTSGTSPAESRHPATPVDSKTTTLVENVLNSEVQLPSVDENSVLNCSNTVDLLRNVMQRHHSYVHDPKSTEVSEDYPIAPPKKKTQNPEARKGSSVSLPGDDVLSKTVQEKSLSKFKFTLNEKRDLDLSTAGTEEDEREQIKSRIKGEATDARDLDDGSSSSEEEEEDEDNPIRRSSASSGTIEPYDTACSGDEGPHHETKEIEPTEEASMVPRTPENSPRNGSLETETSDTQMAISRRPSDEPELTKEKEEDIARSLSPSQTPISLVKSAMLLTPLQWKPPGHARSTATSPEPEIEEAHDTHSSMEPSEHQINSRNALASFIIKSYSETQELETSERPRSAASSHEGSLVELEDDIYKLLSESKDKLEDEEDEGLPLDKSLPAVISVPQNAAYKDVTPIDAKLQSVALHRTSVQETDLSSPPAADTTVKSATPHIPEVPTFSSAELVRKQQELYIQSMREIRPENVREQ